MRNILATLALALILSACASETSTPTGPIYGSRIEGSGAEAPAPEGFLDFCRRHPLDFSCLN